MSLPSRYTGWVLHFPSVPLIRHPRLCAGLLCHLHEKVSFLRHCWTPVSSCAPFEHFWGSLNCIHITYPQCFHFTLSFAEPLAASLAVCSLLLLPLGELDVDFYELQIGLTLFSSPTSLCLIGLFLSIPMFSLSPIHLSFCHIPIFIFLSYDYPPLSAVLKWFRSFMISCWTWLGKYSEFPQLEGLASEQLIHHALESVLNWDLWPTKLISLFFPGYQLFLLGTKKTFTWKGEIYRR